MMLLMLQRVMAVVLAAAMFGGAVALNVGRASAQAGPLPVIANQKRTVITAVVTAIDLNTRQVTLRGPRGSVTIHVSDQVKNLDQLKVGDKVAATYYESVVVEGKKATVGDNTVQAMSATQAQDEQGQGGGAQGVQRTVVVVAKVYAVDKRAGTITLRGPKGNFRTFKVKDPSLLQHFTIGDNVVFKYTEGWAVGLAKT
jgi:Cu/Ag efflux protein CusF